VLVFPSLPSRSDSVLLDFFAWLCCACIYILYPAALQAGISALASFAFAFTVRPFGKWRLCSSEENARALSARGATLRRRAKVCIVIERIRCILARCWTQNARHVFISTDNYDTHAGRDVKSACALSGLGRDTYRFATCGLAGWESDRVQL